MSASFSGNLEKVYRFMARGSWRTLDQIAEATEMPPQSASARLRDLRKAQFGAYTVERRMRERGIYEYRVKREPKGGR